jgi:hypothetical protein
MGNVNLPAEPALVAGQSGCNRDTKCAGSRACLTRMFPVLLPLLVFLGTGLLGINFGHHWDEPDHLGNVFKSLRTGTLLPQQAQIPYIERVANDPRFQHIGEGYYGYPGVIYWLGLGSAIPEWATMSEADFMKLLPDPTNLNDPYYGKLRLRFRGVCLAVSSLGIVWMYLLLLRWRGSVWLALLGSCVLAGSWELAYHARWIATDAMVTQFAALVILCLVMADRSDKKDFWLRAAACAAGLATGTKYTQGLQLIPVVLAWALWWDGSKTFWRNVWLLVRIGLTFAITYLITTPGTILQYHAFREWLSWDSAHYGAEGHYGYTVQPGLQHFGLAMAYVTQVLFSHYMPIALLVVALAALGIVPLLRERWRLGVILLAFPVIYFAYFSRQRVMIVRNMLVLTPFIVVLASTGVWFIYQWVRQRPVRWIVGGLLAVCVCINFVWLFVAAGSILQPHEMPDESRMLADYLAQHPQQRVLLSDWVRAELGKVEGHEEPLVKGAEGVGAKAGDELIAVFGRENDQTLSWQSNWKNLSVRWFGPYELNFNYYPSWTGADRIVLLDKKVALKLKLSSVEAVLHREALIDAAPAGFQLHNYLNCGVRANDVSHGTRLETTQGTPQMVRSEIGEYGTWVASYVDDPGRVIITMTGLDRHKHYVLGGAWKDYGALGRVESVALRSGEKMQQIVKPTELSAQDVTHWQTDVPESLSGTGEMNVEVAAEGKGGAVLSEIWLYEADR